jgi:MinD-like ATPase involved in chromosome partitioning or flagellar assembly
MTASERLVVVVDPGPFAGSVRDLLPAARVLQVGTSDEAGEIAAGARVDLVLLGPSMSPDVAARAVGVIRAADPSAVVVLAARIMTNRILLAAMRAGVSDVVEMPLTATRLAELVDARRAGDEAVSPADPEGDAGEDDDVVTVTMAYEASSESATPATFLAVELAGEPHDGSDAGADEPEPHVWAEPIVSGQGNGDLPIPVMETLGAPPASAPVFPATFDSGAAEPGPEPGEEATAGTDEESPVAPAPAPPTYVPPGHDPSDSEPAPALPGPQVNARPLPWGPIEPAGPPPEVDSPVDLEHVGLLVPDDAGSDPEPTFGMVVAVTSGKGGAGKTVTASNVALALALDREARIALVDGDLQFGDVALLLRLDPAHTIADAASRLDELTDAALDEMLVSHESGVRVLAAPPVPTSAEAVPAKRIVAVLERLRRRYDVVVVDTATVFDDDLITVLEAADEVLMVVDLDPPSVRNAGMALDALRASSFPMDRLRLVVNRLNATAGLDPVPWAQSLGVPVAGSIPFDRLVAESVSAGTPVVALKARSRVAKAFRRLARTLATPAPDQGGS